MKVTSLEILDFGISENRMVSFFNMVRQYNLMMSTPKYLTIKGRYGGTTEQLYPLMTCDLEEVIVFFEKRLPDEDHPRRIKSWTGNIELAKKILCLKKRDSDC